MCAFRQKVSDRLSPAAPLTLSRVHRFDRVKATVESVLPRSELSQYLRLVAFELVVELARVRIRESSIELFRVSATWACLELSPPLVMGSFRLPSSCRFQLRPGRNLAVGMCCSPCQVVRKVTAARRGFAWDPLEDHPWLPRRGKTAE